MRLLAVSMLLIAGAASAEACPPGTSCVAAETRLQSGLWAAAETTRSSKELEAPAAIVEPRMHGSSLLAVSGRLELGRDSLARSLRTHVAQKPRALHTPSFWVTLRERAYSKLPTYEHRGAKPADRFSLTLSPMVVDSPSDTVPGLGIEGAF